MMDRDIERIVAHFPLKPFRPLTQLPPSPPAAPVRAGEAARLPRGSPAPPAGDKDGAVQANAVPIIPMVAQAGRDLTLIKLLFDTITYPYNDISTRIKRLSMSARVFETAKRAGLEQGFIRESSAGQTLYLIPQKKTFALFNTDDPYERAVCVEHAFHVGGLCFLLKQDPACKNAFAEMKTGTSSATADVATVALDGTRRAYEVTLTTGNCLSNAAKYMNTDFVSITFVCRDYKLQEAVRACCREGGLDSDLLARLEYTHLSALLRRQRTLYRD
jgi:hypothetical protein